jgi:hypothetical protein
MAVVITLAEEVVESEFLFVVSLSCPGTCNFQGAAHCSHQFRQAAVNGAGNAMHSRG